MVVVVFIENKYILLKYIINTIEEYSFICLFMEKRKKNITEKIILFIYKDNI